MEKRQSNHIPKGFWWGILSPAQICCLLFDGKRAAHFALQWRWPSFGPTRNHTFARSQKLFIGKLSAIHIVCVDVVGQFYCYSGNCTRSHGKREFILSENQIANCKLQMNRTHFVSFRLISSHFVQVLLVTTLLSLVTMFDTVRNNSPNALELKCIEVFMPLHICHHCTSSPFIK